DSQTTIASLRELNSKLTIDITELRKKYAKTKAKKAELEIIEENSKHEADHTKLKEDTTSLKTKNTKLKAEKNKKSISNMIKERNWEKKIQAQVSHNASSVLADSSCNKILDTETEEELCDNISSKVSKLEQDNKNSKVDASQIVEQGLMQESFQNTSGIKINESYI
ncbi:16569_t:CDS:2, partial [Cetraspora pellucida]